MGERKRAGRASAGGGSRRKQPVGRHKQSAGHGTAARIVAWCAGGAVALGGVGLGYAYFDLNGKIKSVDINGALGTDRPDDVDNGSMDILVLGSDSRAGGNKEAGGGTDDGTARADTAMIVHLDEGRKKAGVVSIPRDTLIDRPSCVDTDGGSVGATSNAMFNSAYEIGGAACAVKTVESVTGIRMDHYLEVDFTGFEKLIDELGGVDVTTTEAIDDADSHLRLEAGKHTLNGEQALGLVRTRKGVGDGSDLGRIKVQQAFMKSLLDQVKEVGVLGNPKKLYDLATTAAGAVTADSELDSVPDLVGFAESVKGLDTRNIHMVTMPVIYDPADPNRVVPVEDQAQQVWDALKADRPIPASATKGTAGDKTEADSVVR